MVLRARPTLARFPTHIRYTPMDSTPLYSILIAWWSLENVVFDETPCSPRKIYHAAREVVRTDDGGDRSPKHLYPWQQSWSTLEASALGYYKATPQSRGSSGWFMSGAGWRFCFCLNNLSIQRFNVYCNNLQLSTDANAGKRLWHKDTLPYGPDCVITVIAPLLLYCIKKQDSTWFKQHSKSNALNECILRAKRIITILTLSIWQEGWDSLLSQISFTAFIKAL